MLNEIPLAHTCWSCKRQNDLVTDPLTGQLPQPGDFSICYECLQPAVFDEKLQLQEPNVDQWIAITQDKQLQRLIASLKKAKERH